VDYPHMFKQHQTLFESSTSCNHTGSPLFIPGAYRDLGARRFWCGLNIEGGNAYLSVSKSDYDVNGGLKSVFVAPGD